MESPTMSQAQFTEVQRAVENFPAEDLKKVKSKLDLKSLRSELSKLNMSTTFLKILARKYNLKYTISESGPNTTQAKQTHTTVKTTRYMLLNGQSKTEQSHSHILKSSLENKQKLFEMFNINISVLEAQLTKLFLPITNFLVLLDNKFQGQSQKESIQALYYDVHTILHQKCSM